MTTKDLACATVNTSTQAAIAVVIIGSQAPQGRCGRAAREDGSRGMVGGAAHRAAVEGGDRAETLGQVLTMPSAHPAVHVKAKPTGAICNLDCEYCYWPPCSAPAGRPRIS